MDMKTRVDMRLEEELLKTIDRFAQEERRTRSNMIHLLLEDAVKERLFKETKGKRAR